MVNAPRRRCSSLFSGNATRLQAVPYFECAWKPAHFFTNLYGNRNDVARKKNEASDFFLFYLCIRNEGPMLWLSYALFSGSSFVCVRLTYAKTSSFPCFIGYNHTFKEHESYQVPDNANWEENKKKKQEINFVLALSTVRTFFSRRFSNEWKNRYCCIFQVWEEF